MGHMGHMGNMGAMGSKRLGTWNTWDTWNTWETWVTWEGPRVDAYLCAHDKQAMHSKSIGRKDEAPLVGQYLS